MKKKRGKGRRKHTTRIQTNIRRQNKANNIIGLMARVIDFLLDENNRLRRSLLFTRTNKHSGKMFGGGERS